MSSGRGFAGVFDKLISPTYLNNHETLYKARILAGIASMYIFLLVVTSIYALFLAPLSPDNVFVSLSFMTMMIMGYSMVLYWLRHGEKYRRCAEITVFCTYAGVVMGVATSGGPLASPATPIMVIPVILAFTLGSKYSGLIWSFVVMATHIAMVAIDRWIFKFPQMLDMSQPLMHHLMHWGVNYFAIILLMLVFESITRRLKQERDAERDRYAFLAAHDSLTGLANRLMFDSQLTRALASSDRNKNIVGLVILDLDGFKPVNDQLGHDMGDNILRAIGDRLTNLLRKADTIARIGGDEFAVILENVAAPPGIDIVAQRIVDEIGKPYDILPAGMRVTASVGVAMYPLHTRDENTLRVLADHAMYEAKKQHDCYKIYSVPMA
ncbi:MAG: GGDEF domain-containing protein [Pseudomonadales bacterium]